MASALATVYKLSSPSMFQLRRRIRFGSLSGAGLDRAGPAVFDARGRLADDFSSFSCSPKKSFTDL